MTEPLAPYDAVLLVGFGGPEGPADVLPFLRRVTAGRDVPDERLAVVARQYDTVGGVSPLNAQNRALRAALQEALAQQGSGLPVYWGNRNWTPLLADVIPELYAAGHRRVLAVLTSAYPSYSGCRQYREDLALAAEGLDGLVVDRVRHYADLPGFVDTVAANTRAALAELDADVRAGAHVVFTAHSIPLTMAATAGPTGDEYVGRLRDTAAAVMERVDPARPWELVWQSRSGPPTTPWLEPDVGDQLAALAAGGTPAAVLVPVGFLSDHMEVVYDLDVQAAHRAGELGLAVRRAATPGTAPAFVAALADVAVDRAREARGGPVAPVSATRGGPSHTVCPLTCCPARTPRPALAGTAADARGESPPLATGRP
ncbi:MAG: ferrochelatase [Mycobacterium sp.]|nr:ferrochelatase [Mycobacterium sp.]